MVALSVFKFASVLAFISATAQGAPTGNNCKDFRVTSPHSYFSATAGQCYQVSYDFWGNTPSNPGPITVDLYEYGSDRYVETLYHGAHASGIATPWFNINLGSRKKSGSYYYRVKYGSCKAIETPYFHVEYNKNSGKAVCP